MKARNQSAAAKARTRNSKDKAYKRCASKLSCVVEWGPWGRLSDDGAETTTPHQSEDPWSNTAEAAVCMAVRMQGRIGWDSEPGPMSAAERTKDRSNLLQHWEGRVLGLSSATSRKVLSDRPALKPDWGKPTVRNFRGEDGNGSYRAILLPERSWKRRTQPR